jgi:hypothetical protein
MLSDSLIGFVNESIPLVARLWLADVRSNHTTAAYLRLDPETLLAECTTGLQQLGRWLEGESTEEQIRRFFRDLGSRRQTQGVPLHELLSAIMLLKRQIWAHARSQGVWQRPVEMYRVCCRAGSRCSTTAPCTTRPAAAGEVTGLGCAEDGAGPLRTQHP